MTDLPSLNCPTCRQPMAITRNVEKIPVAGRFDDCLRRCQPCGIAASNATDPQSVTYIYRDPLNNIPNESRAGASGVLSQALNVRNRSRKLNHFGFSTSEDAVTWVVFDYLFRSNRLPGALRHAGLIGDDAKTVLPQLLLWGVPIGSERRGAIIRQQLRDLCHSLGEDPNSFSEPDVIIDLSDDGLIFIEVKYLSGNDLRAPDYKGWTRYTSATRLLWKIDDVKASGCYELARNWCLLEKLAAGRPATLVNLGPTKLFSGTALAQY